MPGESNRSSQLEQGPAVKLSKRQGKDDLFKAVAKAVFVGANRVYFVSVLESRL